MNISELIYRKVVRACGDTAFDEARLRRGIDCFAADNGLGQLCGRFSDSVVESVTERALAPVLSMERGEVCAYFEYYELAESFRLCGNRILSAACARQEGRPLPDAELAALEAQFAALLRQVCAVPALRRMTAQTAADCTLELDYAAGRSGQMSLRLMRKTRK